jgi:hypothetical protein
MGCPTIDAYTKTDKQTDKQTIKQTLANIQISAINFLVVGHDTSVIQIV